MGQNAVTAGPPTLSCSLLTHCLLLPAGHNYIGTEHILLGLLREGEGVASRVLETLGADPQKIRTQVRTRAGGASSIQRLLNLNFLAAPEGLSSRAGGAGQVRGTSQPPAAQRPRSLPFALPQTSHAHQPHQPQPPTTTATLQVIRMVGESQEPVGSTVGGGSSGSNKMPTLEEYGTNLTTQVRVGAGVGGSSLPGCLAGCCRDISCTPCRECLLGREGAARHLLLQLLFHCHSAASCSPLPLPLAHQAEEGKLDPVVGRKKEIERVTQVGGMQGLLGEQCGAWSAGAAGGCAGAGKTAQLGLGRLVCDARR